MTNIHWINDEMIGNNKIGTMARPRGNDWLDDEIKWLKNKKVDCLVSLLENLEELELGLAEEGKICAKRGIEYINFPIRDANTPSNEDDFIQLAHDLAKRIKDDKKVIIHCRMGIGRASILAAATMITLGTKSKGIFETISTYRKLRVPDTEAQKEWIMSIEDKLTRR